MMNWADGAAIAFASPGGEPVAKDEISMGVVWVTSVA